MRIPGKTGTISAFFAVHAVLAASVPLIEDEAYYALWASDLALSYYDHPAMIAWIIALRQGLVGETPLGVRLLALMAVPVTSLMVARLTRLAAGGDRAADIAVFWFNAGLLISLSGFIATPDAPSLLFWTATLWAVAEALSRPRFWVAAGLFAGLGVLSKLTNLFLGPGLALWLLATRRGRHLIATRWPWVALVVVAIAVSPFVLWNLQNDWLGLERQFGRIGGSGRTGLYLGGYLAILALAGSPVIAFATLRGMGRSGPVPALLVLTSLPLIAYFAMHSLTLPVQANWLAPVMAPFAVLAGLAAAEWRAGFVWLGAGLGTLPAILLLAVGLWPGAPLIEGHTLPNQTKGWPAFLAELETETERHSAEWIATTEYGLTGALVFRLDDPVVHDVAEPFRYDFRKPPEAALCNAPAVLVQRIHRGMADPERHFRQVGAPQALSRHSGGAEVMGYLVTPVSGLRSCGG